MAYISAVLPRADRHMAVSHAPWDTSSLPNSGRNMAPTGAAMGLPHPVNSLDVAPGPSAEANTTTAIAPWLLDSNVELPSLRRRSSGLSILTEKLLGAAVRISPFRRSSRSASQELEIPRSTSSEHILRVEVPEFISSSSLEETRKIAPSTPFNSPIVDLSSRNNVGSASALASSSRSRVFESSVRPQPARESVTWVSPESWAVLREDQGSPIQSLSPEHERHVVTRPEGCDNDSERDRVLGVQAKFNVRIYRYDGAYHVVSLNSGITVAHLLGILPKKLMVGREIHRLYLREGNRERLLEPNEKPACILQHRLLCAGYNSTDDLVNVGAGDIQFLLKFVFKSEQLGGNEEQETIYDSFEYVNLAGKGLRTIPIVLYRYTHTIVLLNLSKNPLLEIPRDFIESCEQLRELRLSNMTMRKIPQSVRYGTTLQRLDVSSNRIADLDSAGLDGLADLLSLKVQNNRLACLPSHLHDLKMLRFLDISNNKFSALPSVVYEMTGLVDLDISFNMIPYISPEIGQLVNLERLIMIGNKVATFPEQCTGLVSLSVLDCRRNCITDLSVICRLPRLQLLRADYNMVETLDLTLGPNVETLEMANNHISKLGLPLELTTTRPLSLTCLDVSHAKLTSLEGFDIGALRSLAMFKMDHNSLEFIPDAICSLDHLSHLSCSNNNLNSLPAAIGQLTKLISIDAHTNSLIEIPQSLWFCGALEHINLASNFIKTWPSCPHEYEFLQSPQHSRQLDISGVWASGGPHALPPLAQSLKRLYLSDNCLQEDIFGYLSQFRRLSVVNVSYNNIRELPPSWPPAFFLLRELYLSGNKLMMFPSENLHRLEELTVLFLNANKLQSLPAELGKVTNLAMLDVGSNLLKYNVNNWEFDWNWNFNPRLRYLNLSGNRRLEIKPDISLNRNYTGTEPDQTQVMLQKQLVGFNGFNQLRILGLMDVATTFMPSIPDETGDLRVRTSSSEVNGMAYGISDVLGTLHPVNIFDLVTPCFQGRPNECLLGMFGRVQPLSDKTDRSAKFIRDNFPAMFVTQLEPDKNQGVLDAMRRTFLTLNQKLFEHLVHHPGGMRKGSNSSTESGTLVGDIHRLKAGAAAVVVYIVATTIYVANVGNFVAVVSREGTASVMSNKHDPFDDSEMARIRSAEGWVSPDGKVNGDASVSRSFGYFHLLPAVNSCPHVCEWKMSRGDEFVIIANSGIWDHMSYQMAVDVVRDHPEQPMFAAQKLRDLALGYGAVENIAVMVLCVGSIFQGDHAPSNTRNKARVDSFIHLNDKKPHSQATRKFSHFPLDGKSYSAASTGFDLRGTTIPFPDATNEAPQPQIGINEGVRNLSRRVKINQRPLRAGGFCDVYSGELIHESGHTELVALKMLRLFNTEHEENLIKAKKIFRREIDLWRSLRHPYVLPFYGTCELDECRLFMVSPWAAGGRVLQYLSHKPRADRSHLLWQTASALAYLHSALDIPQMVHGDLKADNVLVSASENALLCDFGLSLYVEDILSKSGSSSMGRGGGHARFMAPERLVPPKDAPHGSRATTQSDVFAFASLMLQIYTEELPFGNQIPEPQAILKISRGELPPRPTDSVFVERGCDDHVWNVMVDCWEYHPNNRPSMETVMHELASMGKCSCLARSVE